MTHNVSTWTEAIAAGFSPRGYAYQGKGLPTGTSQAVLDRKIWARKVMAINCYFTLQPGGEKLLLTVYCSSVRGAYKLPGSRVDFAASPLGAGYLISTRLNQKNKLVFEKAQLLTSECMDNSLLTKN